jgi:hypothetical protein
MRKLLTFLIALAAVAGVSASSFAQVGLSFPGPGTPTAITATFGKDGTTVGNNATASSVTSPGFSTTNCNNLVIVGIITNAANVTNVTDAQSRLTFTKRAATGTSNDMETWTAPFSGSPLSGDAITVNVSSSAFTTLYVNSIGGYKTSTPFDPNAANSKREHGGIGALFLDDERCQRHHLRLLGNQWHYT